MKNLFSLCVGMFLFFGSSAQERSSWTHVDESSVRENLFQNKSKPKSYKLFKLKVADFAAELRGAPLEKNAVGTGSSLYISIPNVEGNMERFSIVESPVMEPALAAKYPEIKSYVGRGIDNPGSTIRCDMSPQGFHGMILSAARNTIYIDPVEKTNNYYAVFYTKDLRNEENNFKCLMDSSILAHSPAFQPSAAASDPVNAKLRTFRLALACTWTYTNHFTNGNGTEREQKATALAKMNTLMGKINAIYEREVGIRMLLVANNDAIIFLQPKKPSDPDPWVLGWFLPTESTFDSKKIFDATQQIIDEKITSGAYDIGHLLCKVTFPDDKNGATLGVRGVCNDTKKAKAYSAHDKPETDIVFMVAHEMGHQFGANHTFTFQAEGLSSQMEPGSGSTIMGYPGFTQGKYDVELISDDYFHAFSIGEMPTAGLCGGFVDVGNIAPVANSGGSITPYTYAIPISTPFVLTGSGSDDNKADVLTYNWEQRDPRPRSAGDDFPTIPVSTSTVGPQFRSYKPSTIPSRYFPKLENILDGTNRNKWEVLPEVQRFMTFAFTVRDNHPGGGSTGVGYIELKVDGTAGPFSVTDPNGGEPWAVGSRQQVKWTVNKSDQGDVNCKNVNILLSTDGGQTFPIKLASGTANDGSELLLIPDDVISSTKCRVKVEAVGNIFFDISNANFTIDKEGNISTDPKSTTFGCNRSDGKVTITPTGDDFEYQVCVLGVSSCPPYQPSNIFERLATAKYKASIKNKKTGSVVSKEFIILQGLPDPKTVSETTTVNDPVADAPNGEYCNGKPGKITFSSPLSIGTFYWTSTDDVGFGISGCLFSVGTIVTGTTATINFTAINSTNKPITATLSVRFISTLFLGAQPGPAKSLTITVNPTPTVNSIPDQTYCDGDPVTVQFTSNVSAAEFSWQTDNVNVGFASATGQGAISFTAHNNTNSPITANVKVKAKADNCDGPDPDKSFKITVYPEPEVTQVNDVTYENGSVEKNEIAFTSVPPGANFEWTSDISVGFGTSGGAKILPFTAVNLTDQQITANVTVTARFKDCFGPKMEFKVKVNPTPKKDNAKLSDVKVNTVTPPQAPGTGNLTGSTGSSTSLIDLNPPFESNITDYTASVDNDIAFLTVTPTTEDNNATVTVNGNAVTSGNASAAIPLCIGSNIIKIVVTAQDGVTTKTYTIVVTRAGPAQNWYVDDGNNNGDRFTIGSVAGNDVTGLGSVTKPFRTITKAISIASCGDNIYVDAGTYSEFVNVTKSLKIYGPNYDQSPLSNPSTRTTEALITAPAGGVIFQASTNATNIEIKGFKLLNGAPLTDGHVHRSPDQDIDILFEKNWINRGNNLFAGTLTRWRSITIKDNHFTNIDFTATSSAIQLNDTNDPLPAPQRPATVTAVITDNKIETTNFGAILLDNIASATVQRNIIKAVPHEAIQLAGGMGNATISENDIRNSNLSNASDGGGIRIYGSQFTGTINIRNNFVTNNTFNGVAVKNGEAITNPNIHINNNSFTGLAPGSYGIYHGGTNPGGTGGSTSPAAGKLDGECNWFGSPNAAIVATKVFGQVDFTPWLNNGTDGSTNPGFQPSGTCSGGAAVPIAIHNGDKPEISGAGDRKLKSSMANTGFNVRLVPNPTKNNFALTIESSIEEPATVNIMDATGRILTVFRKVSINSTVKFGHNLAGGIYYAQVSQGDIYKMIKLIKIH